MTAPVPESSKPGWTAGLTNRQWMFVSEYLVDLNGTQAAIRAGYAESGAAVEAHRLLRKANIAEAISAALAGRTGVTQTRIVDELAAIGFTEIHDLLDWDDKGNVTFRSPEAIGPQARRAISSIKMKDGKIEEFRMHGKQAALEKLGKIIGIDHDTLRLTGHAGGAIEIANMVSKMTDAEIDARLAELDRKMVDVTPEEEPVAP